MLAYVEKVSLAAASCTEEDVQRLRDVGFRDEDILDIVVLTAYRHFITRVADALGCQLRGEVLDDPRIVEALATGKPAPASH